jgi:hypothetical protein
MHLADACPILIDSKITLIFQTSVVTVFVLLSLKKWESDYSSRHRSRRSPHLVHLMLQSLFPLAVPLVLVVLSLVVLSLVLIAEVLD